LKRRLCQVPRAGGGHFPVIREFDEDILESGMLRQVAFQRSVQLAADPFRRYFCGTKMKFVQTTVRQQIQELDGEIDWCVSETEFAESGE
jgi:hypothetical protein